MDDADVMQMPILYTDRYYMGLPANPGPDAEFIEEAMADGFIVATEEPTKTEKAQDNNVAIITHDSQNPEANRSQFQKDNLPKTTIAKTPEAQALKLTSENTNQLVAVTSIQTTALLPKGQYEGSTEQDGSGDTLTEDNDLPLTTTPTTHFGDRTISTSVFVSSEKDKEAEIGSEDPTPNQLTTTASVIVEDVILERKIDNVAAEETVNEGSLDPAEEVTSKPESRLINIPGHDPKPAIKEGTPSWLLILALCLTLLAVICVFVAIATKDMWFGPSSQCFNLKSTESKKQEEYNKAELPTLSDREKVALMSIQSKTDSAIISIEEIPEKEYLM
ncbi:CD44 antigen [Silurus asotus]|uniref:CD44 antigen n=1 Tax=Silurus asotus TaxID=30991 RepID=A0AAD5B0A2_SILAS|nr:CD44 antigen [Silurus asotus]